LTPDHQIIKALALKRALAKQTVAVYDIEVDCPTHSFIANNVIVHNSACTTRLVAGAGYPQFSALLECAHAGRELGIPIIADGGIRAGSNSNPGGADLSKAIGAGASHEAPGLVEERDGRKVKIYRGMASMDAFISKQLEEGKPDEAAVDYVPEGITAVIPYRDVPAAAVIAKLVGGLRSGMAYSNARTIEEFQERVRFVQQTTAGMGESRPHALEHASH
jgi:IMP dehydrogenase/GMP reductase